MASHTLSHPLRIVETMSNEVDTQLDDAIREVTEAINTYGKPVWVAQVPKRVRDLVPNNIKAELLAQAQPSEGWRTAQDGKQDIMSWCKNHVFELVTVKELAEIGDISEATVRKIVQDRPDIFVKREGRQYEIRDPQADRKADK
jgi:hypothetical protein